MPVEPPDGPDKRGKNENNRGETQCQLGLSRRGKPASHQACVLHGWSEIAHCAEERSDTASRARSDAGGMRGRHGSQLEHNKARRGFRGERTRPEGRLVSTSIIDVGVALLVVASFDDKDCEFVADEGLISMGHADGLKSGSRFRGSSSRPFAGEDRDDGPVREASSLSLLARTEPPSPPPAIT